MAEIFYKLLFLKIIRRTAIFVVLTLVITNLVHARQDGSMRVSVNDNWEFSKEGDKKNALWSRVRLPHTWNVGDVMDDVPGYYRGKGWYRRKLVLNQEQRNRVHYLHFEGVGQAAEVFLNGKKIKSHAGGYTAFSVSLQDHLNWGKEQNENELLVVADNSHRPDLAPLSADFTFYGGIYRDVFLISCDPVHVEKEKYGTDAWYITQQQVSADAATIHMSASLVSFFKKTSAVEVQFRLIDKAGKVVSEKFQEFTLSPKETLAIASEMPSVKRPVLWSPETPYLYTALIRIIDKKSGQLHEEISQPIGLRWYRFDAEKGFFLNGKSYKLIGTSRHQDYQGIGNAIPDELAVQDVRLLKEMGGNFLRIAHYPQDPSVLQACDRLGIIASVEIPVVNEITESEAFYSRCEDMLQEMIYQQYNHSSVVIWCYMNEILLRMPYANDKVRQEKYIHSVTALARRLDSLTRSLDSHRYTMIAHHGDFNKYHAAQLTEIPMLVGWNLYSGWYGGVFKDFASFLDRHHAKLPHKPLLVTEYGADADPRIRSFRPVRFDKSLEYTTSYHQYYLQSMMERSFVSAAMIWNLADFNSESRVETMPHINNKGLLTWSRYPKDGYLFYQSRLLKEPFIKIAAGEWNRRSGVADSSGICYQPVQVMSNADSVSFFINEQKQATVAVDQGVASCTLPFTTGKNVIKATMIRSGACYSDQQTIDFSLIPYSLSDAKNSFSIHVLLGAERYYFDQGRQQVWIPDQPYRPGSFGYIDGSVYKASQNNRLPYGTDKNILGTDDDPVYQTQRTDISGYRFDVPPGKYELSLHWAELEGGSVAGLIYNLEDKERKDTVRQRVFDVLVNGQLIVPALNLAEQYGLATAVSKKIKLDVKDEKGIKVALRAIEGEAVLNAIQLIKLD